MHSHFALGNFSQNKYSKLRGKFEVVSRTSARSKRFKLDSRAKFTRFGQLRLAKRKKKKKTNKTAALKQKSIQYKTLRGERLVFTD